MTLFDCLLKKLDVFFSTVISEDYILQVKNLNNSPIERNHILILGDQNEF